MKNRVAVGLALAVGCLALTGLVPAKDSAALDAVVVISARTLRPAMTVVNRGEPVTWINVSGTPVARLVFFDDVVDGPAPTGLFTSSVTRSFSRPGEYPYTVFVGARWASRGQIVVK